MTNADISRIINSDEVQSAVQPAKQATKKLPLRAAPEDARSGHAGGHEGAQGVAREEARHGCGREEAQQGLEGVLQEHDGRVRGEGGGAGGERGLSALTDRLVDRASFLRGWSGTRCW